jgi:hypothetical protein
VGIAFLQYVAEIIAKGQGVFGVILSTFTWLWATDATICQENMTLAINHNLVMSNFPDITKLNEFLTIKLTIGHKPR